MRTLRLALAQTNPTVGDLDGNTSKILEYVDRARAVDADLVAFPELAITGYPPEDLLFKPQLIRDNLERTKRVAKASRGICVVFGFADESADGLYNAAAVASGGELVGVYRKIRLPNYGVFDEQRYFRPGRVCPVYVVAGTPVGVNVCEDIWFPDGPTEVQRAAGAEVIVNINGSPYDMGKRHVRERTIGARAADNELFIGYVNMVGGQDELVFDGASVVFGPAGEPLARAGQFEEELLTVDLEVEAALSSRGRAATPPGAAGEPTIVPVSDYTESPRPPLEPAEPTLYDDEAEVYAALVSATRDYVRKSGHGKALVALSGGIDSSLVATVAVDALGAENVVGVSMPSRYSSEGSLLDAMALADNLGIELRKVPIEDVFGASLDSLDGHFDGAIPGLAQENLQSRVRGLLVMALSNRPGWLVLTTGNKSEMAVGYATIYGDMAGGYAVIKDVPKTLVYRLARYRNGLDGEVIPESVLTKPPSAELRPDQTDQDSLPPYEVLDPILKAYVEEDRTFDEIVGMGFDADVVKRTINLVDRSEYKRRRPRRESRSRRETSAATGACPSSTATPRSDLSVQPKAPAQLLPSARPARGLRC